MTLEARTDTSLLRAAKQAAEPLTFRSLQETVNTPLRAEQPTVQVPDPETIFRTAYEQGRSEGVAVATKDLEVHVRSERALVSSFADQFQREKQRYFSDVEQEVVKLSLAIAERVLRRESEMDPTLLAAAARVALEQVSDSSEAVLRVAADEVDRWSEAFSPATQGIAIEADKDMKPGECVLKTRSGTVQLGVRAQLQEIERGFFELLGRRPAMAVAAR